MRRYIPRKGDFVVLTFNPQSVHEQRGRRPTLIISNDLFNQHTGLAISCPITSTNRQIPFHVAIPNHPPLKGFVMVDQVKSIDFKSRKVKYIGKAPAELLNKVLGVLDACLY